MAKIAASVMNWLRCLFYKNRYFISYDPGSGGNDDYYVHGYVDKNGIVHVVNVEHNPNGKHQPKPCRICEKTECGGHKGE